MGMKRVFFYLGLAVIVVLIGVGLRYFVAVPGGPGSSGDPAARATPPPVGGPFSLVNQHGEAMTEADFRGRHMLILFGYTYCPDICPTVLTNVTQALGQLGGQAEKVQPLFITVDPERDTPAQLKAYLEHFDKSIIGLTGSPKQIEQVKSAYKVYAAKLNQSAEDPEDYLMNHASTLYLMGPKGKFEAFFGHTTEPETMVRRLKEFLR